MQLVVWDDPKQNLPSWHPPDRKKTLVKSNTLHKETSIFAL